MLSENRATVMRVVPSNAYPTTRIFRRSIAAAVVGLGCLLASSSIGRLTPPIQTSLDFEIRRANFSNSAERYPPLSDLIGDLQKNISTAEQSRRAIGDLLDFAILGNPKTGTTYHLHWLHNHESEIQMADSEVHELRNGRPAGLVKYLYELAPGSRYKRGFKSPHEIASPSSLEYIAEFWPKARLLVGLRHPVLWFQSYYNFRVRKNFTMPPAEELIHSCPQNAHNVCVEKARFHLYLSLLGKTNVSSPSEAALLQQPAPPKRRMPNKIFLWETTQLSDVNNTRRAQYREDISRFLGLQQLLEEPTNPHRSKQADTQGSPLNICEERHTTLRRALLDMGRPASVWIQDYFLKHDDVVVSSEEYFRELLDTWMIDPCA